MNRSRLFRHSGHLLHRATLRTAAACAAFASLTTTITSTLAAQSVAGPIIGGPVPYGTAVINEILIDPLGAAGSEGAWQWVEILVKNRTDIGGWKLENANGQTLCTLPNAVVERGSYVVVLLGPTDVELENTDPAEGTIIVTAGLPFGDHLGIDVGGVKLRSGRNVLDQVGWGAGSSVGPVVPIRFPAVPLREGDTLGRNRWGADTDSPSDFTVAGGRNANGPTPGSENVVELPDDSSFLLLQDDHINQVLAGLSNSEIGAGWIQVTDTSPAINSSSVSGNVATFSATHTIQATVHGAPVTFAGIVQTTFERTTTGLAAAESYHMVGTLTSAAGYSFDLDMTRSTSGSHGFSPSTQYSADYVWHEGGSSYPVSVSGIKTDTILSDDVVHFADNRTVIDFGGYGTKTAVADAMITRVGDGAMSCTSTVTRSFPSQLPIPGGDQSWATGSTEVLQETFTMSANGLGQILSGTVTAMTQSVDGYVVRELQQGAVGSMTSSLTPTASGQDYTYQFDYPLEQFGAPQQLTGVFHGTVADLGTKEVMYGSIDILVDGVLRYQTTLALDPPAQDPPEKKSFRKKLGDALFTTATCVGAGFGAQVSVGTTGGKKAMIRMVGKSAAKRIIPGVGWVTTGVCGVKAILDW